MTDYLVHTISTGDYHGPEGGDNFMNDLNAIPTDAPSILKIQGIPDALANEYVDLLWRWKFHYGDRSRANIIFEWENAKAQVRWNRRITALMDEHHPTGAKGFIEHYFEVC